MEILFIYRLIILIIVAIIFYRQQRAYRIKIIQNQVLLAVSYELVAINEGQQELSEKIFSLEERRRRTSTLNHRTERVVSWLKKMNTMDKNLWKFWKRSSTMFGSFSNDELLAIRHIYKEYYLRTNNNINYQNEKN